MKNPPSALLAALFGSGPNHLRETRHNGPNPSVSAPRIADKHHGGVNNGDIASGEVPVEIPRYAGIDTGQALELYLNDVLVADGVVLDKSQSTLLYIPSRVLPRGDTQNSVHYHCWIGFNGSNEQVSFSESLRVKTNTPGNPPGDPTDPGVNPYLAAPNGVPPSIPDPGAITGVAVGIPVYDNMTEGDEITVFWGGAGVSQTVTASQVGGIVYIQVPQAIIAARPGNGIAVRYGIYDAVGNYSLYSQSALTHVAPVATLPAPLIVAAPSGTLDMDRLAGSDVEIMVLKGALDPASDITLHFTGQPDGWAYLDYVLGPIKMGSAPFHTFTVPNVLGRSLVSSEAIVFYEAVTGSTTERSLNAQAQVIGRAFDLPAPQVPEAPGGLLDPDKITGATFDVIALGNTAFIHDIQVQLVWEGANGAGDTFEHELTQTVTSATAGYPVTFKAQKGWAEEIAGGSVEVHYNLIVPGTAPVTYSSEQLPMNVGGEATLLPLPQFEPALTANDELDVDTLTGTFNVKVNVTNQDFVGGTLKVHWDGQAASRTLEAPVSATGVIRVPVDRTSLIDPNLDQSVDVWYEIIRPGGRSGRSGHVLVSVISAASQVWPAPEVHDHTGGRVNPWSPVRPGTSEANVANFVLRDARLQVGDAVAPIWLLPTGESLGVGVIIVTTTGQAQGEIPVAVLRESLNKTVRVSYVPIQAGGAGPLSEALTLQVLGLPDTALSELVIVEAANSGAGPEFDVTNLASSATVRIGGWPLIAAGQSVWLHLTGTNQDGSAYNNQLLSPPNVVDSSWATTGSKMLNVPAAELKNLKDGSSLTMTLKVDLGGGTNEARAVSFTPQSYRVKSIGIILAPPLVVEAPTGTLDFATVHTARHITVRAHISATAFDVDDQSIYTVRVRWAHEGLVYRSEIVETTLPNTLNIQIPRLEVIDVIGAYADIHYTVYGNGLRLTSEVRRLYVTGQDIALPAPRFAPGTREVTVLYPAQLTGHKVVVRWTGVTTHETASQDVQTGVIARFSIPAQWVTENAGQEVLVNYSVLRRSGELKLFSRLLRLQL